MSFLVITAATKSKYGRSILMKKRLRKKLHKGEFKELGFNLEFYYTGDYKANEEFFSNSLTVMINFLVT